MKVNVISDNRSWILKRMAQESIKHPKIEGVVGGKVDNDADINYFVNYNLFKPTYTKTVASFTHHDPKFMPMWKRAEKAADGAVYMAERYKPSTALSAFIPPAGLDYQEHKYFTIGIVGAQYTDGRKGEDRILAIAKALKHLNIHWHFHGGNWHVLRDLRALDTNHTFEQTDWVSDEDSIEFYKSIDLYLLTSKLEGGPVPALEAAKVGVPIIAFNAGNIELWGGFAKLHPNVEQVVLTIEERVDLHNKRMELCEYNWEAFAIQHYKFFRRVLSES